MNEKYFEWLCQQVKADKKYNLLMRKLYSKEYYWTLKMDENRSEDGKNLRKKFGEDFPGPCSVLELLVSLSLRWYTEMISYDGSEEGYERYFWKLIKNLGLNKYTDKKFDVERVDYILETFLDRTYEFNGKGGLFPLKKCSEDQRKVELWYQLQNYEIERAGQ